jgi:hypothetical protein
MKRYRLLDQPAEMDEYEQGDYVRYEDAVAAISAERERCAQVCEARAAEHEENAADESDERFAVYAKHERRCAAAIRKG